MPTLQELQKLGTIKKVGSTTSLLGSITTEIISEEAGANAWEVEITAEDTSDYLKIRVRGDGTNLRWMFGIELTEIRIS